MLTLAHTPAPYKKVSVYFPYSPEFYMHTKSGMISTWKLGSECSEIKQDAQRHQLEFPKVKLIETVPCYSHFY